MKGKMAFMLCAVAASAIASGANIDLAAAAGLKEIGRLATCDAEKVHSSKWVFGDGVPANCTAYETATPNPDAIYASIAEPLRKRVKEKGGALDIFDRGGPQSSAADGDVTARESISPGLAGIKYEIRRMTGDAVRAIPCRLGKVLAPAARNLVSLLDNEALPSGIAANGAFKTVVRGDPKDKSRRTLSCAKFMRYNCPLRFYWFSDRAPSDDTRFDRISFKVPGRIERPVWVDLISGRVFEIPAENVSFDGKNTSLANIPMWDSPVLIAAMNCVPREIEWEKLSPREIVDYWYKPQQFENHMKALPPEGAAPWMAMAIADFLPCIDRYGQFKWRDWPGKTKSDEDLKRAAETEAKDLAAHPGPAGWDRFGGWAAGPQLEATGRFRTEKRNGRWWLVDPDGRLYWSFGPVRVTPSSGMTPLNGDPCKPNRGNALPLPDRDCLFAELPPAPDAPNATPFSKFWTTFDDLLLPFYRARGQTRVYDFSSANLFRKYGADYVARFADLAHRRLRSWGANTIANSSDLDICLMDRTPYAERVECESRTIAGSYGMWKKFRDPWDESFSKGVARALETHGREAHDPWCIGFFVDNEINWGFTPRQLADWTMQSPADQPAKIAAVGFFREKYGDIAKLNAAWKSSYADWDDLLHSVLLPGPAAADDLAAFTRLIAETYFRKTREAVKAFDPQLLYLGCRFVGSVAKPWVIGPCAKYCDVVSYNIYLDTVGDWRLPDGLDAPVMVGEFHFGATDRGPFGTGVCVASNQTDRAAKLKAYVRSALANPQIVGVHWHQFADQATSGRFDGEYLQVGWTDICDTPYPETINAVREVGYSLYETRAFSLNVPERNMRQ